MIEVLALPIFGVLWRIRGGWLNVGNTTLARLIYAIPFGGYAFYLSSDPYMGLAAICAWLGMKLPWAHWMDMGHVEENDDFTGVAGTQTLHSEHPVRRARLPGMFAICTTPKSAEESA
ncbi:hypothetical protein CL634_08340 [bacterium]|nr:hypothetical protein [bacterium]